MSNRTSSIRQHRVGLTVLAVLLISACSAAPIPKSERPERWAQPVEAKGVPNLHRITETFYRGAQPDAKGFKSLAQMGVKTVVNLRQHHEDDDEVEQAGVSKKLKLVHIPMQAWDVTDREIISFLQVVADPANHPIFFHCKHGADRTGTMAAAYRMVFEGWSSTDAIEEMKLGGYNYHAIWKNLPRTLEELDVTAISAKVNPTAR